MKQLNKSRSPPPVAGRRAVAEHAGRLITFEKNVWRVFCLPGNGRVSGSCGHSHRTLTRAMRCSYVAYQRGPEAELRVRPVRVERAR